MIGTLEVSGRRFPQATDLNRFEFLAEDISRMSHAHPTFAEAIKEAALAATRKYCDNCEKA